MAHPIRVSVAFDYEGRHIVNMASRCKGRRCCKCDAKPITATNFRKQLAAFCECCHNSIIWRKRRTADGTQPKVSTRHNTQSESITPASTTSATRSVRNV